MDTKVVKIDKEQIDDEKLMEAAEILRAGGLVAFQQRRCMDWGPMR